VPYEHYASHAEQIEGGPTYAALRAVAARFAMAVVYGALVKHESGVTHDSAVVIDCRGECLHFRPVFTPFSPRFNSILGEFCYKYDKRHPTNGEIEGGVTPGEHGDGNRVDCTCLMRSGEEAVFNPVLSFDCVST